MRVFFRLFVLLVLASSAALADDATLAVQTKLRRLGYYDGRPDGQSGSQTAAAIRRYQIANNLKVTGELNPQTLKSLGIASAPAKPAPAKPVKPASAKPAPTPVPQYIAIADIFKGGPYILEPTEVQLATIRKAKKNLKLLGYYSGPVNDLVTPELKTALKAWQRAGRFPQTGRFSKETLGGLDLMP